MSKGEFTTTPREVTALGKKKTSWLDRFYRRPKLRKSNAADKTIMLIAIVFAAITLYTVFFRIEYKWDDFSMSTAVDMVTHFFRFDTVPNLKKIEALMSLLNTLALGFLTTFFGFASGIILGLFAAKNLIHGVVPNIIRSFASVIRAVPTIIWVLIVVAGFGLTSTTAVIGMYFHTLAFFIKSFAEAFEEIDEGTLEALKATGANWLQIVVGAVLPSSLTKVISWIAIRSEINFGVAVVIGPAAGVPGTIGTIINNASRAGEYAVQGFGVILIFATAFIMEFSINYFRQKSIIEN